MEAFLVAVQRYLCTQQQNLDILSKSRRMKITENQEGVKTITGSSSTTANDWEREGKLRILTSAERLKWRTRLREGES